MSPNVSGSGFFTPDPEHHPTAELLSLLESSSDVQEDQLLIHHLTHCVECQHQLEIAAGRVEDWEQVQQAFQTVEAYDLPDFSLDLDSDSVCRWDESVQLNITELLRLLTPSDDPRAAGRIGPFEIIGIVGSGGMGIVLKAKDPVLERFVAIKLLAPHLASSESARRRFAREARAAAAVLHDNVIAIYQVAHWKNLPFLVMPYLPDPSLQQRLDQAGGLELESCLAIGVQLARGLAAAHAQGLVHRDVKPANVLLCSGTNRAIITDFGLARAADDASITRTGAIAGTPHYMSPEQARGKSVDQASDLFSLGSVLFAMAAGRPPADCELGTETISRIASGDIPSLAEVLPAWPSWYVRLVDWLHSVDPDSRPHSAHSVADLLEQSLAHVRQPNKVSIPLRLVETSGTDTFGQYIAFSVVLLLVIALSALSFVADQQISSSSMRLPNTNAVEPIGSNEAKIATQDERPSASLTSEVTASGALDWNGIAQELESIGHDVWQFEHKCAEYWSITPELKSDGLVNESLSK